MTSAPPGLLEDCARALGRPVEQLRLLGDNKYCSIHQVIVDGKPIIVKKYKTSDATLASLEAGGVDVYQRIVPNVDGLIDGETLFLCKESNLVGFSFIEGQRLADFLHTISRKRDLWDEGTKSMVILGRFLAALREETLCEDAPFDPFHEEYFLHCSRQLRKLPILGAAFFSKSERNAKGYLEALASRVEPPSTAHGDFVFRNIHVADGRVGIIDFANTLPCSHPLNDMMNLWFALSNMWIPRAFREILWRAFLKGYGPRRHDTRLLEFFHEYHRRRWLTLNLKTSDPRCWLRAIRGLTTFARHRDFPPMESGS